MGIESVLRGLCFRDVQTSRNGHSYKEALATPAFWEAWKFGDNKARIKGLGYSVYKKSSGLFYVQNWNVNDVTSGDCAKTVERVWKEL